MLVSTDVCARGIHVKRLQYVVNYDFPGSIEQYCHRIGRVGRQGAVGRAYSLLTRNLAVLAPALVDLLRACGQTVEPNLATLSEETLVMVNTSDGLLSLDAKREDEDNEEDEEDGDEAGEEADN